jgi:hypothetical protein
MTRDPLLLAWAGLVTLSLAGAGLSLVPAGPVLSLMALSLALLKGRIILHRYLGLAHAPRWRRGFDMVLAGFCAGLAGLALLLGTGI